MSARRDGRDGFVEEPVDESDTSNIPSATSSDMSSSSSMPFYCDICGRGFPSENSLKMHRIRVHGGPPPRLSRPINVEVEVPDALKQLHNFLVVFGLSERDAQAVLKYMESYSLDDLVRLNAALRDIGLAYNRRKLLIESWANLRNIVIPLPLQRELGIQPIERNISMPSPYGSTYSQFESQPQPARENFLDYLLKWEQLKQQARNHQPNPLEVQIQALQDRIEELKEAHKKEVEALREELQKERERHLEEKLKLLEEQLKSLQNRPSEGYTLDEYRLLSDAINRLASKEPIEKILQRLPEILNYITAFPPQPAPERARPQPPPQIKRKVGESEIAKLLPPELVEVE